MAIISGTFFTPKDYPGFLKGIATVLPLTHYTELIRNVMLRNEPFWSDAGSIAVVLAWGALGAIAALRRFRWQPRES
jgi:ABC-2 type transport system permease protein